MRPCDMSEIITTLYINICNNALFNKFYSLRIDYFARLPL